MRKKGQPVSVCYGAMHYCVLRQVRPPQLDWSGFAPSIIYIAFKRRTHGTHSPRCHFIYWSFTAWLGRATILHKRTYICTFDRRLRGEDEFIYRFNDSPFAIHLQPRRFRRPAIAANFPRSVTQNSSRDPRCSLHVKYLPLFLSAFHLYTDRWKEDIEAKLETNI